MRTTLPWASPAILLALTLGCAQETPSKKAAGAPPAKENSAPATLAANQVTLHIEEMS